MNQEKIGFDNLLSRYCTGPYAYYVKHDKSVGCITHFLYTYGLMQYDGVQIGGCNVSLRGKRISEYRFDHNNMPFFNIIDDKFDHVKQSQEIFLKGIKQNWHLENYFYNSYIKDSYKDKKWFYQIKRA